MSGGAGCYCDAGELCEEVAIELEALQVTVEELQALQRDLAQREPTVRENAAAAAFLAQFYNGIENILKRISLYCGVPLPTSDAWHVDLFQRFCSPPHADLPPLFDSDLAVALAPYRRFRHVAFHSYGFQLDWVRMAKGVAGALDVFRALRQTLSDYLQTIGG